MVPVAGRSCLNTATAYIGLGSNLGDGLSILQRAWKRIGEHDRITLDRLSSPYLTEPMGMKSSNWFTNAAGALQTSFSAQDLLAYLLTVEAEFGRTRLPETTGYQDRTLDLDILVYDDSIISSVNLILPHPELEKRLFVLEPLAEIAPELCSFPDGVTMLEKRRRLLSSMAAGEREPQKSKKGRWNEG